MPKLPVSAGAIRKLLRDICSSGSGEHVLAVGGAGELAPLLRQQLRRGGAEVAALRLGDPEGADAYVLVLRRRIRDADLLLLKRARRARVPLVAVAVGFPPETTIPNVLATDVVWVHARQAFPLEAIAAAIAVRLRESGAPLAARVPLLRRAVGEQLIASSARKNGVLAATGWIPGSDRPYLTLNQLRLVLRLAQTYGAADGVRDLLPELAATFAAGLGLRAFARGLLDLVPGAAWAIKGAIAYGGTRAVGEAGRARFELGPTQRPGGVARVAP